MRKSVTGPLIHWIKDHPDVMFHIAEPANDLGLLAGSIGMALIQLAKNPNFPLEKLEERGTYIYHSNGVKGSEKKDEPELYEKVGLTQAGETIVRDEKGLLWKLSGQL